eukprot:IDg20560t1
MSHASQRQSRVAPLPGERSASQERYWETVLGAAPTSASAPSNPALASARAAALPAHPALMPLRPPGSSSTQHRQNKGKARAAPRLFECARCEARFERRGHLQSHINTVHERKRPFQCPRRCGKVFAHRSSLNRHLRITHGCEPESVAHAA